MCFIAGEQSLGTEQWWNCTDEGKNRGTRTRTSAAPVILHVLAWRSGLSLKRDGTRAETRFRLSAKRTSQFKSAGASVQSTTGSQGVRISGSNAG